MKKSKIIPGILLLVLCVAVLAVGVYAASPANNKISGTIKVNAADAQVEITAYFESINANNIASKTLITRTGGELTLNKKLVFELSGVNSAEDFEVSCRKTIVLEIKNNSSKSLGVFFSEGEVPEDGADDINIATTKDISYGGENVAKLTYDGYKELPGNSTISTNLVVSINSIDVESLETLFNFDLTIETFQPELANVQWFSVANPVATSSATTLAEINSLTFTYYTCLKVWTCI